MQLTQLYNNIRISSLMENNYNWRIPCRWMPPAKTLPDSWGRVFERTWCPLSDDDAESLAAVAGVDLPKNHPAGSVGIPQPETLFGVKVRYMILTEGMNGGYELIISRFDDGTPLPEVIDLTPFVRRGQAPDQDWRSDSAIPEDFYTN